MTDRAILWSLSRSSLYITKKTKLFYFIKIILYLCFFVLLCLVGYCVYSVLNPNNASLCGGGGSYTGVGGESLRYGHFRASQGMVGGGGGSLKTDTPFLKIYICHPQPTP